MKLKIYTDGGARNNPGPAAIGIIIKNESGKTLKKNYKYLGIKTNNQAEYWAIIEAFNIIKNISADQIDFYLDSKLVAEQLNRQYKVKNSELAPLFVKIWNFTLKYKKITFNYIPREQNKEADKLVNKCLDNI